MTKTPVKTKVAAVFLLCALLVAQAPAPAMAASARPADVKKAGKGNMLVRISGTFESVGKSKILKRINEIRKEACAKGYINPSTGKKLTSSDYVPIKWSANLELVALLRAVECTVNEGHTRPNGESCFSIMYGDEQSWAENLAWNYSGMMQGIEQWYSEKKDWVNQNPYAVTGHYTSLINPAYKFIGLGSFRRDTGGWYGVSAEFGSSIKGSQAKSTVKGKTVQVIEVKKSCVKKAKLNAPSTIKVKKKKDLSVSRNIGYPGSLGENNVSKEIITKGITWKSSKPSVLSVNKNGKITAKKAGKATITAKIKGVATRKKTITVKK